MILYVHSHLKQTISPLIFINTYIKFPRQQPRYFLHLSCFPTLGDQNTSLLWLVMEGMKAVSLWTPRNPSPFLVLSRPFLHPIGYAIWTLLLRIL
ncbi:hypothetical protein OIU74_002203 [Salix koriyanagi]|uniref:Uncharacterized protein n=1 Tax=Salix koriyanagi TaxID=2511006 RepID=A0A9Q0X6P0_9ROSI|nr:hypothetical protein OIU74_002203 [Salix koriyanagi]